MEDPVSTVSMLEFPHPAQALVGTVCPSSEFAVFSLGEFLFPMYPDFG